MLKLLAGILLTAIHGTKSQILMPPGTRPIANPKNPCHEVQNVSDVVSLPRHKYMVLEHCLYYHIQRENDKKFQQPNALVMLPPSDGKTQNNISVAISSVSLQHLWMNDMMKDLHTRGFFSLSWSDPRIRWDDSMYKVKKLRLQTTSHLWVPQIASIKHDSAVTNGDFVDFKRIETTQKGEVSAYLNFNLQTFCDVDIENYPDDTHHCCFHLQPKLYEDITDFSVNPAAEVKIDYKFYQQTGWKVKRKSVDKIYDEEGLSTLRLCVDLGRSSTTLRIELSIPMAICAVLVLFSPLFGNLLTQLYVKLYALLLQYLCLQYLANKTSALGMGNSTPRIFRFYEWTIAVNLLSIIISLIISSLARKPQKLPPSSRVSQVCAFINGLFCCLYASELDEGEGTHSVTNVDSKNYRKDWKNVYAASHAVLMLIVICVYLIGIIAIYC